MFSFQGISWPVLGQAPTIFGGESGVGKSWKNVMRIKQENVR